ncbi:MAG: glucosaminidase domain-containing protein [Alphaproteobacteria bacterium]
MLFGRLRTASQPWSGGMDFQRGTLAILATGVGALYLLALLPLVTVNVGTHIADAPLLQGQTSPAEQAPQSPPQPEPRKLAAMVLDLDAVRAGDDAVPRLVAISLPDDLPVVKDVATRKAAFFSAVLPLVLLVNEEILAARERLTILHDKHQAGEILSLADSAWLDRLAAKYKIEAADFDALLLRVDTISPALTLAQAAEESGWGRSRFAQQGNALFGQRTWVRGAGIVPSGRSAGESYEVRAFTTLLDSVRAYALNLNTHGSYADLRALRATMGAGRDPIVLATALLRYSERGPAYVRNLQAIIRVNGLVGFEKAKLAPQLPTQLATRPIR